MASSSYDRAVAHVLASEGGYVDHPSDPGGATNRGITLATLSRWRGRHVTRDEVKGLSEAEARQIYRRFYWDRVRGDELPAGLDLAVFDFAVNSGDARAARMLQGLLGLPEDGLIGPKTVAAALAADSAATIRNLTRARLDFLSRLDTWPVFGKGWRKRVLSVEAEALAMVGTGAPPPPDVEPVPSSPASGGFFVALKALLAALFGKK